MSTFAPGSSTGMTAIHPKRMDRTSCPVPAGIFKRTDLLCVITAAMSYLPPSCYIQRTAFHSPPPYLLECTPFLPPLLQYSRSVGAGQGRVQKSTSAGVTEFLGRLQKIHQRPIIEAFSGDNEPVPCGVKQNNNSVNFRKLSPCRTAKGRLKDYPAGKKPTVPKENRLHIEAFALLSEIAWSSRSPPKGRLPNALLKPSYTS